MPAADHDGTAAAKAALRSRMRAVRRTIAADDQDRRERSGRIGRALDAVLASGEPPQRVMLFESLPTEPDASGWAASLAARGVSVFVPDVDGPHLRVHPGDLDPAELDAIVVPGLAFTADGRRLGQGGGHYDRFLARVAPTCRTIGVCFAEQLVDDLPTAPFDRRVDVVVTDASDQRY